jgi:hypothetical protein
VDAHRRAIGGGNELRDGSGDGRRRGRGGASAPSLILVRRGGMQGNVVLGRLRWSVEGALGF